MYDKVKQNKNLSDDVAFRFLLDDFLAIEELGPQDWEEIYLGYVRRMTTLRDKWLVLKYFYKAVEVRSDFTVANRVAAKLLAHFDELFEKLPGLPWPYFIPSERGRALFEALVNPLEREKVQKEAEQEIALVRQLSLDSFFDWQRGVRA